MNFQNFQNVAKILMHSTSENFEELHCSSQAKQQENKQKAQLKHLNTLRYLFVHRNKEFFLNEKKC